LNAFEMQSLFGSWFKKQHKKGHKIAINKIEKALKVISKKNNFKNIK